LKRIAITLTFVAAALVAFASPALALKHVKVGSDGFDFTLDKMDGTPYTLSEHLGEKATLLIFWATWSPKSADVLKDFDAFNKDHGHKGLNIVAINVEHSEWQPSYMDKIGPAVSGVSFPVVIDKTYNTYNDYGVITVPTTLMLGPTGTIRGIMENYSSMGRDEFQSELLAQLGEAEKEESVAQEEQGYKPKGAAGRYYGMGKQLAEKHRYNRALPQVEKAVEIDPDYADAYLLLAELYEKLERGEEATTAMARATELGAVGAKAGAGSKEGGAPATDGAESKSPADAGAKKAAPDTGEHGATPDEQKAKDNV